MNFKRILQTVLCFVLIACVLVNASPIKAEALSVVLNPVTVSTTIGVSAALVALGFAPNPANIERYEQLVNYVATHNNLTSYVASGYVKLFEYINGDELKRYIDADFLQATRDTLFSSGIVYDVESKYPGQHPAWDTDWNECYQHALTFKPNVMSYYYTYNGQKYMGVIFSSFPLEIITLDGQQYVASYDNEGESRVLGYNSDQCNLYGYSQNSTYFGPLDGSISFTDDSVEAGPGVLTYNDVIINEMAPSNKTLAEGYPKWTTGAITVPGSSVGSGDDQKQLYPMNIPGTKEEVYEQKQEIYWGIEFEDTGGSGNDTEDDKIGVFDPLIFEKWFSDTNSELDEINTGISGLGQFLRDLIDAVKELPQKFADWFNGIIELLQQLVRGQISLAELLAGLFKPIRDAIVDALTYLFAPSETFITGQVDNLIQKYPTSQNLFTLGDQLKNFFLGLGQTPPIIYINLGNSTGSYYWGGTVAFLDLTWYAQYKPTMDAILGGFLWLWFAWRMWLKLPGILEGVSGEAGYFIARREDNSDN